MLYIFQGPFGHVRIYKEIKAINQIVKDMATWTSQFETLNTLISLVYGLAL